MDYEKQLLAASKFEYPSVPILFREVQNARGQCFYLNAKDKLSTLEPQVQGLKLSFFIEKNFKEKTPYRLEDGFAFSN